MHPPTPPLSRCSYAGAYEHVFESTTAGVTIQAPQLDINTVAAGGGSRLFFRAGVFQVGASSAPRWVLEEGCSGWAGRWPLRSPPLPL